jgi:predicted Zn-dependent protease
VRRALAVLALAGLACPGVQTVENAPLGKPVSEDERGVLFLADESEKRYAASGLLLEAPELDAYLLAVAKRLQPPEVTAAVRFRIRVLRDRSPNATSLPNGALFVTTGMLARLEDEAELAAVLGHEMSHVVHRHSLLRERMRAEVFQMVALSQLSEYSQEHEREADHDSVTSLARAGYRANAAGSALVEIAAWDKAERVKDPKYSSHPPTEERIAAVTAHGATLPAGGAAGVEAYGTRIANVLLVNARLELAAARYEWARAQAERHLRLRPASAQGYAVLGEIARREAGKGHEQEALRAYRKAVALDPKLAEAWRGLGLVLQKTGDRGGARKAFTTYLELAPDAPDRGHARAYLDATEGRSSP